MFPDKARVIYDQNPILEVVAQLRYPTYLAIGTDIPARFQEAVWETFPLVEAGQAFNFSLNIATGQDARQVKNVYDFYTQNREAKLTLTDEFVAVSVRKYSRWEEFSKLVNTAVKALVSSYKISSFTRIGLRYVDLIDREGLGLSAVPWSKLVRHSLLGVLKEDELGDGQIKSALTNFLYSGNDCQCAINCGLPNLDILDDQKKKVAEAGNLLVLDTDFFSLEGEIDAKDALQTLSKYNRHTRNAFRWAIQEELHQALKPNAAN